MAYISIVALRWCRNFPAGSFPPDWKRPGSWQVWGIQLAGFERPVVVLRLESSIDIGGKLWDSHPVILDMSTFYVRSAKDARDWYESVLGLHTYDFKEGRAAFMSADLNQSHEIALMEVGENADGPRAGQVGLNHMAWRMGSLDDLSDFYNNLKGKGLAHPAGIRPWPVAGHLHQGPGRQRHRGLLRDPARRVAPAGKPVHERRPAPGQLPRTVGGRPGSGRCGCGGSAIV